MKKLLYKNRNFVLAFAMLLLFSGILISLIYWGKEPQETIGGFLFGFSFGIFLIYFAIKNG